MIESLSIKHFRNLQFVELNRCGRVNLLLGRNNSGKTAVLEALLLLFLPPNPREVLILLNEQRGYKPGEETPELWDSFFYNWDHSANISIEAIERPPFTLLIPTQALHIYTLLGGGISFNSTSVIEGIDLEEKAQGLLFKYQYEDGSLERTVTTLKRKTQRQLSPKAKAIIEKVSPIAFIPARGLSNPQDEAERFSRLEKANRLEEVVDALRVVEPRLKRLTVLASGKGSMIYGDVGSQHLMPVSLMGEGILRMLSIAMSIVNNKGGLVLVDEIENGLHYSVLPGLWKMIFETARRLDVQVFAATHSDECIQAASQTIQELKLLDDLRLYRLDRLESGTRVVDYSAKALAAAIETELEVR